MLKSNIDVFFCDVISLLAVVNLVNLAKQGYCNHFVSLCVCVSVCLCVCVCFRVSALK